MNCQPPKIISRIKNFPGEAGEGFGVRGGETGKLVEMYKKFEGLTS